MNDFQILIDFYNLHLKAGQDSVNTLITSLRKMNFNKSDKAIKEWEIITKSWTLPNMEEKNRLIEFFRKYESSIVSCMSAEDCLNFVVWDKPYPVWRGYQKPIQKPMPTIVLPIQSTIGNPKPYGSLGEYQYLNLLNEGYATGAWGKGLGFPQLYESGKLHEYIRKNKDRLCWFESLYFCMFLYDYHTANALISDYMKRDMNVELINIINSRLGVYSRQLRYIPEAGGYTFIREIIYGEPDILCHKLGLNNIMYSIHDGLAKILTEGPTIRRCAFDGSTLLPGCENIYIPTKSNQLHCSRKCSDRNKRHRSYIRHG